MPKSKKSGERSSPTSIRNLREVAIPDKVDVNISGNSITVKGPKGQVERTFHFHEISVKKKDNKIIVDSDSTRRKQKAMVGTIASHIQNMVTGVTQGFEYKMKVCYSHFPVQVSVAGNEVNIVNFLGEKKARKAKIIGGTKVEVKGDTLSVTGIDIESLGQTAANIEIATKIKEYDPRVFQDGIYITSKPA